MPPRDAERHLVTERHGAGERVVLVHGFTQTGASMRALARHLEAHFEVVTLDLPFHGRRPRFAASLEDAAAMVGENCGAANYLGYSLGGRVCLTLALEHPELVRRLVLVGATPGIADAAERLARRQDDEALAARLRAGGTSPEALEGFLAEWLAGPLFSHLSAEQADLASRRANATDRLGDALQYLGTGTQVPSYGRLGKLDMPVLLLAGARDAKFSAIAKQMGDLIGVNANRALIAGSGHAAPFEAPEAVAAVVREFLERP